MFQLGHRSACVAHSDFVGDDAQVFAQAVTARVKCFGKLLQVEQFAVRHPFVKVVLLLLQISNTQGNFLAWSFFSSASSA